jgi:transcription elongation factor
VEVDLEDGEGIANVPWSNLRKHVAISNFAKVISGAFCGEKGWVVEISGDKFESVWIAE